MKQIELPFTAGPAPLPPDPDLAAPRFWIARLLLLRAPRLAVDAVLRDIRLRRGLNILWAPPASAAGETQLFEGRLTGHTAGKTTFCRLIRYLLGEPRFAAARMQDRIRERLPDGWVVGEVFVGDDRWVVGRPFSRGLHPFAARGVDVGEALEARGAYQDFLAALASAVLAPVPVHALPHARRPLDWEVVLTWLMRDQEARYAGLVHFRDPASESQSPSPTVGDRHVVLRALLGLMADEERAIQEAHEALWERRRQLDVEVPALRERAAEERRRLAKRLGVADSGEAGPLFSSHLRERVAARKAALERARAELAEAEATVALALRALAPHSERTGATQRRLDEAVERLERQRRLVERLDRERGEAAAVALPDAEGGTETEGVIEAMAEPAAMTIAEPAAVVAAASSDEIALFDAASLAARRAVAPGFCKVPLALAAERGCPFAPPLPVPVAVRAQRALLSVDAQEARDALAAIEREVDEARGALDAARAAQQAAEGNFTIQNNELHNERGRAAHERAALEELERLLSHVRVSEKAVLTAEETARRLLSESRELSERRSAWQRGHTEALARLSERFGYVARALLGSEMDGAADVSGGEIRLRLTAHGERDSAAIETVKVLSFDLAALTLGTEGHGHFPGFLVHDGPREADMDPHIYERLFLYAHRLEEAIPGRKHPAFQYIVTTTAPPPARLQAAPWLLDPLLDASVPEGRLLGMDL